MDLTHEAPFRMFLVAVLAFRTVTGLCFWRKANRGEKLDRRQEGWTSLVGIRLLALVYGLGVMAYILHPGWMAWSALPLPLWLRSLGVALNVAGLALATWGLKTLGGNFTDTVVTRREHALVTSGPYRWVRHPLYSAYFLIVAGVSLLMASWFPPLVGGLILALLVRRTRTEEAKLVERFGEEYRGYMRRVGRFIPR